MPYINYKKGEKVKVKQVGIRGSLQLVQWIPEDEIIEVTLLDDAISGTWDVFDVKLEDGTEEGIYGFNIVDKK